MNKFNLKDKVTVNDIYNGKEVFDVIGIREKEIEIGGDFSGGTHMVYQTSWVDINKVCHE